MEHSPILPAGVPVEAAERFLPTGVGIEAISAVARALNGFNRDQLGSAIEVLIALMDVADGDPDAEVEDAGGETVPVLADPEFEDEDTHDPDLEENGLEDGFWLHPDLGSGPGCEIADHGEQAYVEWTTLRPHQKRGLNVLAGHEDDEDDDPDTGVEDDPRGFDPEQDMGIDDQPHDEDTGLVIPDYGDDQSMGPEPVLPGADRRAMLPHRDRIRRNHCDQVTYGGTNGGYRVTEYRLRRLDAEYAAFSGKRSV
jgi:hypothetical protein